MILGEQIRCHMYAPLFCRLKLSMKLLAVLFIAVVSSGVHPVRATPAKSMQPRGIGDAIDCAAKTVELTSAVSNCNLDAPDVDLETLVAALDTATQLLAFSVEIFEALCEPTCGQPIVDFFYSCGFQELGVAAVELCSELRNNTPCYSIISPDVESFYTLGPSDFGTAADTHCRNGGCSIECRDALMSLRDEVGCCVNLATTELFPNLRNVTEDLFWAACDMTVPGECQRSLVPTDGAAMTTATFIAVITATIVALLV